MQAAPVMTVWLQTVPRFACCWLEKEGVWSTAVLERAKYRRRFAIKRWRSSGISSKGREKSGAGLRERQPVR